jgi:hypothetical protein
MKFFASFLLLASLSSSAFSQTLIKSCQFEFDDDETGFSSNVFEVRKKGNKFQGKMITSVAGQSMSDEFDVTVRDYKIRAGLSAAMIEDEDLGKKYNHGEALIIHAMALTDTESWDEEQDENSGPNPFSAGLDLIKVRSVKVYEAVGGDEDIGSAAIIEAKDAKGKDLGSFIGGFLVLPCK